MRRLAFMIPALVLCVLPARAELVWMVKSSGVVGCADRETLIAFEAETAGHGTKLPEGCVELYSGERLVEQHDMGVGFDAYMRAQRGNGRIVHVRRAAVVSDVGIGSMTDDRQ